MAARSCVVFAMVLACLALAAESVGATTIVPMSDRDLVASSRAIVEGTVVSTQSADNPDLGAIYTYVTFDVETCLKGDVPVGQVVLRELGGTDGDVALVVRETPELAAGDRAVLFLNTDADGVLHVAHMRLGAYRVLRDPDSGALSVDRRMGAGYLNPRTVETITWSAPYDDFLVSLDLLVRDAASDVAGTSPATPIRLMPPEFAGLSRGTGTSPAFTLLGAGFRWFEPDNGRPVRVKVNNRAATTPSNGIDEVKLALAAWSTVSGSMLHAEFDGLTDSAGITRDSISAISYGDPKSQLDDLVNCQGVIALASVVASAGERRTIGTVTFSRIIECDLIVNNGVECLLTADTLPLQEILTHEFGHDLGLGHSSERFDEPDPLLAEATMFFIAHNDARGAALRRDDSDAIRSVYPGPNGPLFFNTTAIPDALSGVAYSRQLDISGGDSPYAISLAAGALPPGISLSSTGLIFGTATGETTASFTVRVVDSASVVKERALSLRVSSSPAPFIESASYSGSKLRIAGLFLGPGATVDVNGVALTRTPKYKMRKGILTVSGTQAELNLRLDHTDVIVVTIGGRTSNAHTF